MPSEENVASRHAGTPSNGALRRPPDAKLASGPHAAPAETADQRTANPIRAELVREPLVRDLRVSHVAPAPRSPGDPAE